MADTITLRLEEPADYKGIEQLTYAAFRTVELPGRTRCDEHYLAHILRTHPDFVPELDYVALDGERLVGNIMYAKSGIRLAGGDAVLEEGILTFGPLSVLPAMQGRGIGALLVQHTLEKATMLGYKAVIIFGHPTYYARFGFENAIKYGITTGDGQNFDAFMAKELVPGGLTGLVGTFALSSAYEIEDDKFETYTQNLKIRCQ